MGPAGKEQNINMANTLPFPKDSISFDDSNFPNEEQEKGQIFLQDHSSPFPGQDDPWGSYGTVPAGSTML